MTDSNVIQSSTSADLAAILDLYRAVAAHPGGLAREADEVSLEYVQGFVSDALATGFSLVARTAAGDIIGEIHTAALGPRVFAHVLGDLTIAVHPDWQGKGIGRQLFTTLLDRVRTQRPDVLRVELITRESNAKARDFYTSLGFREEGRLHGRIRSVGGGFEADVMMGWQRNPQHD
ncbi:GNAT family N-acetyltransferase [Burkholderiaceae bacterium DAT-1]|nr:GNAT family N-acetyltransferase [Burkholderiaceae bacterium DAT-1]